MKKTSVNKKSIKAVLFGLISSVLVIIILTLISSVVITQTGMLSEDIMDYVTLAFIGLGSLLGGYISGRIFKSSGIFIGAVSGAVLFVALFFAGIGSVTDGLSLFLLLKLVVSIVPAMLGGILGVNKKQKIRIK